MKEKYLVLKEKETWILGTTLFVGFSLGIFLNDFITLKRNFFLNIAAWIVLYLSSIFLVAFIKLNDRLILSYKKGS